MTGQTSLLFIFGLIALGTRVFLAVRYPDPTPDQQGVFRTVLALAAAGIAGVIPGMFDIKSNVASLTLSATGTLAVFAFVYLLGPKTLPSPPPAKPSRVPPAHKKPPAAANSEALRQEIDTLREQVAALQQVVSQRGVAPPPPPPPAPSVSRKSAWLITFLLGTGALAYFAVLYVLLPSPTAYQFFVVRILLALLAGGVGSILPGSLSISSSRARTALRALGGLVLFVIIYFFTPAYSAH